MKAESRRGQGGTVRKPPRLVPPANISDSAVRERGRMKSEILYPGAFPMVRVELAAGETIKAESGAMVASSPTIDIESKMEGGFLGALSRKFVTGEKFFF